MMSQLTQHIPTQNMSSQKIRQVVNEVVHINTTLWSLTAYYWLIIHITKRLTCKQAVWSFCVLQQLLKEAIKIRSHLWTGNYPWKSSIVRPPGPTALMKSRETAACQHQKVNSKREESGEKQQTRLQKESWWTGGEERKGWNWNRRGEKTCAWKVGANDWHGNW